MDRRHGYRVPSVHAKRGYEGDERAHVRELAAQGFLVVARLAERPLHRTLDLGAQPRKRNGRGMRRMNGGRAFYALWERGVPVEWQEYPMARRTF